MLRAWRRRSSSITTPGLGTITFLCRRREDTVQRRPNAGASQAEFGIPDHRRTMDFKRLAMNLIDPLGKDRDVNQPMKTAAQHLLDSAAVPVELWRRWIRLDQPDSEVVRRAEGDAEILNRRARIVRGRQGSGILRA